MGFFDHSFPGVWFNLCPAAVANKPSPVTPVLRASLLLVVIGNFLTERLTVALILIFVCHCLPTFPSISLVFFSTLIFFLLVFKNSTGTGIFICFFSFDYVHWFLLFFFLSSLYHVSVCFSLFLIIYSLCLFNYPASLFCNVFKCLMPYRDWWTPFDKVMVLFLFRRTLRRFKASSFFYTVAFHNSLSNKVCDLHIFHLLLLLPALRA